MFIQKLRWRGFGAGVRGQLLRARKRRGCKLFPNSQPQVAPPKIDERAQWTSEGVN